MDKTSPFHEIKESLEQLLLQVQNLEKKQGGFFQIDKDLLLEKTRRLYEKITALEANREQNQPRQEAMPGPPVPETIRPEKAVPLEDNAVKDEDNPSVPSDTAKPETPEKPVTEISEAKKPSAPIETEESHKAENKPEKSKTGGKNKPENITPETSETTLDLFSGTPHETLGETLIAPKKPALADTLQSSNIADLREAIDINDKFLFINELFNGDLERYNKVIDELNGFTGLSGALTYLTELQVQYQWEEKSHAYQKLNTLLERKFA